MPNRKKMLQSIANIIADYRQGEISPRTPELINDWLQQFPAANHDLLIESLAYVFSKTYISQNAFKAFLKALASNERLSSGSKPRDYWQQANILRIQLGGNSQNEILNIFDEVLQETHGFSLADTGSNGGDYIYLDDCIGTGSRVRGDICSWLEKDAPEDVKLHIITPVLYQGSYWIDSRIKETAEANGKTISIQKWRLEAFDMENRRAYRNSSEVLWPTKIPQAPEVEAYVNYLKVSGHPVVLRKVLSGQTSKIFRDEEQRDLLEQAFLLRGCQIRQECTNLPDCARPLGFHNLDCLGFGSMFITYRNCPNNCPLALWVQQAGYPALFPRKTNKDTETEQLVKKLKINRKRKK